MNNNNNFMNVIISIYKQVFLAHTLVILDYCRSTIDLVFCLKLLIEKKMYVDQLLHLLYIKNQRDATWQYVY